MGLYISTAYVDVTDPEHRYGAGEDGVYETAYDDPGDLYRALQGRSRLRPWEESMGRCTGKVYVDEPLPVEDMPKDEDGTPDYPACPTCGRNPGLERAPDDSRCHRRPTIARHVGWIFVKRERYEDSRDGATWLREAWVTVHTAPDTVTRTPHYAELRP